MFTSTTAPPLIPLPPTSGSARMRLAAPPIVLPAGGGDTTRLADPRPVVICSFHTPDDYYAGHARALRAQLEALDLPHELHAVTVPPGHDWADVTRRKLGIIHETCQAHPDALVLWIDVDCRITHLPDCVRDTSADLIGFQRSFRSALHIGYQGRNRFWEPCFLGFNATPAARRLVADAYALERRSSLKATDDYFLEEAWRANADAITFQVLPSTALERPAAPGRDPAPEAFFRFGSSGNVAEFKDKVVQHASTARPSPRKQLLRQAKRLERSLPSVARRPMRRWADSVGITGVLTADSAVGPDPQRAARLRAVVHAGMAGDAVALERAKLDFDNRHVRHGREQAFEHVADAFAAYALRGSGQTIRLAWWSKPYPGNFGDWLSPLLVAHATEANIRLQPVTQPTREPHLVGVGSIGRFIRQSSVVTGTGISRTDVALATKARYVSVRGPITAQALRRSGGPSVEAFGDPAVLLSRVIPLQRAETNGRIALVRHFAHAPVPLQLPEHVDELPVLMSRPEDIERFLATLVRYDAVLTSALHVMIACHSYQIPCGLVTFEGFEGAVHGDGIKYEDYARGVGVPVANPQVVGPDLRGRRLEDLVTEVGVSEEVKDRVQAQLRRGVALLDRAQRPRRRWQPGRTREVA